MRHSSRVRSLQRRYVVGMIDHVSSGIDSSRCETGSGNSDCRYCRDGVFHVWSSDKLAGRHCVSDTAKPAAIDSLLINFSPGMGLNAYFAFQAGIIRVLPYEHRLTFI